MLTAQEIFDKAWHGLASQGWCYSRAASLHCAYRGEHGRKCAVGWLIADTEYSALIEGSPVAYASSTYVHYGRDSAKGTILRTALISSDVDVDIHLDLLCAMQDAHDRAIGFIDSKARLMNFMREVAVKFNLSIPEETH